MQRGRERLAKTFIAKRSQRKNDKSMLHKRLRKTPTARKATESQIKANCPGVPGCARRSALLSFCVSAFPYVRREPDHRRGIGIGRLKSWKGAKGFKIEDSRFQRAARSRIIRRSKELAAPCCSVVPTVAPGVTIRDELWEVPGTTRSRKQH